MARVELTNDDVVLELEAGESILDGSLKQDINHVHACGGNAYCSTCRIYVEEGLENLPVRNGAEEKLATKLGLSPEVRLACQVVPEGDLKARRLVLDEVDQQIVEEYGAIEGSKSLGKEIEASVLFVDIADYTAFAEKTPAYDVVHVLNRYFHIAGSIIKKFNGQIIDYYGDGFLAVFGIDGDKNHAANLISAGFALQDAVEKYEYDIRYLVKDQFRIRLGAHTGNIIWGTIGIQGMQKQAAIGDTVNFASRIEQANKELDTKFLISEALYKKFNKWCTVSGSHEIRAKGKKGVHRVYALDRMLAPLPVEV